MSAPNGMHRLVGKPRDEAHWCAVHRDTGLFLQYADRRQLAAMIRTLADMIEGGSMKLDEYPPPFFLDVPVEPGKPPEQIPIKFRRADVQKFEPPKQVLETPGS